MVNKKRIIGSENKRKTVKLWMEIFADISTVLAFYFISIFPLQSCEEFLTKIMQKIREESKENKFSATLLAVLFFTQSALSAVIYSGLAGE